MITINSSPEMMITLWAWMIGPELTPTPRGILRMAPVQVTPTWEVEQR